MVTRATAQVAFQAEANVILGGCGVFIQETDGRHHHAWRAKAALQTVVVHECLLHRMHLAVLGEALDGGYRSTVGLGREDGATLHRFAIQMHGACTATGSVATDVGTRQVGVFANVVNQQGARLHVVGVLGPVDGDGNLHVAKL